MQLHSAVGWPPWSARVPPDLLFAQDTDLEEQQCRH
jgi:hypothetical protein